VNAATSAQKSANVAGKGIKVGPKVQGAKKVGTGQFKPTKGSAPKFINSPTPANAKAILSHDKRIPGKLGPKGSIGTNGAATQATSKAAFIPQAHSLPVTHATYTSAKGLNAFDQDSTGGYIDTPPDQALAEGNGYVFEAVNNVFAIYDTNFGHITNAEPMEQFWAPAILVTGFCSVSDPKAHYDNVTRKWYVTEVAYGPPGCAPGSAVFIAVSTTSDPLSIYNIYVLDTSFDGTTCGPDGCIADQPLLGMNKNALFISTNSFDWDSPAFNGTQMYIIDSTALAAGFLFPNIVYADLGFFFETPEGFDDCGGGVLPDASGIPFNPYCWYSIQPGTSPNLSQVTDHAGTEFGLSALDWFGSTDNRVALWSFTNTTSIGKFGNCFTVPQGVCIFVNYAVVGTESYGFPFTDTPFFSPYAEQPSSGNQPLCDIFVGPFCEPGPIANNDDRMNEVKTVKPATSAAHNWAGLNSDALVADPLGKLHRRSVIAYFDISASAFAGPFVVAGKVNGQGYIANWNNDVIFPAIGVGSGAGTSGAIVYTLTGNTHFPSVAVSRVSDAAPVSSIPIVLPGADILDDFAWYFFGSPRWGDYSAAVGDGHWVYLATEYIQYPSCDTADFIFDPTCGGTRSEFSNWGTGLVKVNV
jgi:hypothetical protein